MAGIGFELRKLLRRNSITGWLKAYAYAGIIGSGPWIISIVGLLLIGLLSAPALVNNRTIAQFQIIVTYLMATTLTLTGLVQLAYTRYVADQLFLRQNHLILPTFNGLLLTTTWLSGLLAFPFAFLCFPEATLVFRTLFISSFVLLANIWVASIMLTSLKAYRALLGLYALGYGSIWAGCFFLQNLGLEGLLLGFIVGQLILLTGAIVLVTRQYPSSQLVSFSFTDGLKSYPDLMLVGFLFNLGLWIDKLIFWFNPDTSSPIIGALRASEIYDLPIFIAYLSIIPGMAVFLMRMETDFVEYYDKFYNAVRGKESLETIQEMRNEMVWAARQGLFEIIKIQALAIIIYLVAGQSILRFLGISELYEGLLMIDLIACGLQVVFLGLLNVFFYLDRRKTVLLLTSIFAIGNLLGSIASIHLGAPYYGYGFAVSLLIVVTIGFFLLNRQFDKLEYRTFMLQ